MVTSPEGCVENGPAAALLVFNLINKPEAGFESVSSSRSIQARLVSRSLTCFFNGKRFLEPRIRVVVVANH